MAEQTPAGRTTWRSLIYYLLVIPAAMQVLSGLDEHFEYSALIGRLVRAWQAFVHGIWADLIARLQGWIDVDPSANQIDALSWILLMLGAAISAAVFGPPKLAVRASPLQAGVFFWLAFLTVAVIFVAPYLPAVFHYGEVAIAEFGWVRTIAAAILGVYLIAFAAARVLATIKRARAEREGAHDLTPLWSDIESLLGPFVAGGVVGGLLALPVLESEAAVEGAAAQATDTSGGASILMSLEGVWAPALMIRVFTMALLVLRRYNWPTMVRQVATAMAILIGDRLIIVLDPLWRQFQDRLGA